MLKKSLKVGMIAAALSLGLIMNAQAFTSFGPVKRGETLWSIAKKTRPNHRVSVDLMMSAIEKLNPGAFDDSSKGILHVGAKLTVPSSVSELRDVLHGKLPAETAADSQATPAATSNVAPATSANTGSAATVSSAPASSVPVAPNVTMSKAHGKVADLQNTIAQLQQQLQAAQQAQVAAAADSAQQLQVANQKITDLQQANLGLQAEIGAFPWAWLWFILLALFGAYWYWNKRQEHTITSELAVEGHESNIEPALESDLFDEASAGEHDSNSSILADALIAMAEGDYKAAKRILLNGIRQQHDNIELRMKLLEVYVQLNDRDAFNAESDYLLKNLINETDDAWKVVRAMYLKKWVYDA